MLRQSYLPKSYCWQGRSIQVASEIRDEVDAFMARHPGMSVYSGLRPGATGDHRCGLATDIVPHRFDDRATAYAAYEAAVRLQQAGRVAYVEPFADTWVVGNHHVHVSWRRCPRTLPASLVAAARRLLRR